MLNNALHQSSLYRAKSLTFWRLAVLIALSLGLSGIPIFSKAQLRGFVRKTTGTVTLKSSGAALEKRSKLQNGDIIVVGKGGSCVVALRANGAQYRLPAGCVAQVGGASVKHLSGPALVELEPLDTGAWEDSGMNPMPRLLGNLQRSIELSEAGPMNPFPIEPLRTPDVKLTWKCALPDPEGVKLLLTVSEVGDEKTLLKTELDPGVREFKAPDDLFETGLWYQWTLTIVGGDYTGHSCMGIVRKLPAEEKKNLEKLEAQYEMAHKSHVANVAYDLPLARQYKWSGYWNRAKKIYMELLKSKPNDPALKAELESLEHNKATAEND